MSSATAIPYVLQNNYVSVVLDGKAHQATRGQATFKQLHRALERGQWSRVPKLVTLTAQMAERTHGKVDVNAEGVFYKGQVVDNSLSAKIMELIEHGQSVTGWLRFMDNLYQQPDVATVNEVYEWLNSGRFCLTSDGCFLAYKVVDNNYKDKHTNTVDNHVGSRPLMARSEVDPNCHVECSRGFHFCSLPYIPSFYERGDHIMILKVNPADVVAIPRGYGFSKGRTWTYEVIGEVEPDEMLTSGEGDAQVMMEAVVEIPNSRMEIIKKVKALPTVKRLMRRGKMTSVSFSKASLERLVGWLRKFSRMDIAPSKSKLFDNPIRFAREAAGLTMGQVRTATCLTLQEVYNAERCLKPSQEVIDQILIAIAKLQGNDDIGQAGVSYPRPSAKNTCDEETWDGDEDEDEEV